MLSQQRMKQWETKTLKLNEGKTLKIGDFVETWYGSGKVTEIYEGVSIEDHGAVFFVDDLGVEESVVHFNWEKNIRIIS